MIKKLLSLVLALTLVLSLSAASFAAEADIAGEEANLNFLTAFSLTNETAAPDKAITRLELAEVYYKLVTKTDEVSSADYPSVNFTDVNEEMATAVDFAYRLGLMNGIGGGLFNPDGTITYGQLLKTMVSFLGYDIKAQTKGGYPNGYILTASELGLTDNSPASSEAIVTWAVVQDVFMNAANADVALYLNEEFSVLKGVSYLEQYRNVYTASGVVTADNFSDIDNDKSNYYGFIKINSIEFAVLESAKDIITCGGMEVNIMYTEDGRIPEILYFQPLDNKVTVISGVDVDEVTDKSISYRSGDKLKKLRYDIDSVEILYNGSAPKSYSTDTINPFDEYDGSLTCIDNDGNGAVDVIYVSAYKVMVAGDKKNNVIYNKFSDGTTLKYVDLSELPEGTLINIEGTPLNPDDIKKNDILTYETDPYGKVTKVTVTIDVGGGLIEGISRGDSGDIEKITISGTEYTLAKSVKDNPDYEKLGLLGNNVKIYFGIDANVADFEIQEKSGYKAGLVTDIGSDSSKALTSEYFAKIYTEAEVFEVFKLAKKVKIYHTNQTTSDTVEAKEVINILGKAPVGKVERQLVKYKLNEAGEISEIITAGGQGLYYVTGFEGDVSDYTNMTSQTYLKSMGHFGLKGYISSSSKVFKIPNEANRDDDDAYSTGNSSLFQGGTGYKVIAYTGTEGNPFMEYIVHPVETTTNSTGYNSVNALVVEKVVTSTDSDGMTVTKLIGYNYIDQREGQLKRQELILADNCKINFVAQIEPGDIIGYANNAAGRPYILYQFLDYSENDFGIGKEHGNNIGNLKLPNPYFGGGTFSTSNGEVTYTNSAGITGGPSRFWGMVTEKNGNYITIECGGDEYIFPMSRLDVTCTINERTGDASAKAFDKNEVYDSKTFGDAEASMAFIYVQGEYWRMGAIYNK